MKRILFFLLTLTLSHANITQADYRDKISIYKLNAIFYSMYDTYQMFYHDKHEYHLVQKGQTYWSIANDYKPSNVLLNDYISVLKSVNKGTSFRVGSLIKLPNLIDLYDVILPTINIEFDLLDKELINEIKYSEGDRKFQSVFKSPTFNNQRLPSFRNNKFYPYKDSLGNWTIGYGHFISKSESSALKYRHGISELDAHKLLLDDMNKTYNEFILLLQKRGINNAPKDVQKSLFELSFMMGTNKLSKFNNMLTHIANSNYEEAGIALQQSLWARQVQKERVQRIVSTFYI